MEKPKFEIGEWVKVRFDGAVEGIPVHVFKEVFIIGVYLEQAGYNPNYSLKWCYTAAENVPSPSMPKGKTYSLYEFQITALEPLISEMKKAQSQSP